MKEALAERLLASVMNWRPEELAEERPVLQAMAAYKYDEYQQFSPGLRFIESLALWLDGVKDPGQKQEAYRFVRERLVFFSTAEMQHLVGTCYPDFIRPLLMRRVAAETGLNAYHLGHILASRDFRIQERSCLFLGLSDGARTDVFRRANEEFINHEQVLQNYEINAGRIDKLLEKLRDDLTKSIAPGVAGLDQAKFRTVVLLDDFSASGTSYLRQKSGRYEGKLFDLACGIAEKSADFAKLCECDNLQILIVLYIATQRALEHIRAALKEIWREKPVQFEVFAVHPLAPSIQIKPGDALDPLLNQYYEPAKMENDHTSQGGTSVKYGYADCGLPVVLAHNSPNNSIFPIWNGNGPLRALFPRVSRHKQP